MKKRPAMYPVFNLKPRTDESIGMRLRQDKVGHDKKSCPTFVLTFTSCRSDLKNRSANSQTRLNLGLKALSALSF
jgi:hypothetical protein